MSPHAKAKSSLTAAPALVLGGALVAIFAWLLPVSLKSVSRALLASAGADTPSLSSTGLQLVDSEKLGPAAIVLEASRALGDPGAGSLEVALKAARGRQPAMVPWGGWDPTLVPLLNARAQGQAESGVPVLTFLIPEAARDNVSAYLAKSGSVGVQAILATRQVPRTGRFVPASRPGGQPLDALILLTAVLYQEEKLAPALGREVRSLSEAAVQRGELGDLEAFYMDLLSLGRRLDWTQLGELLKRTESTRTVGEYALLARAASDQFAFIYSAALFADSSDRVASYLLQYGKAGAEDLRLALSKGRGAVNLLLQRGVPVNRSPGPAMGAAAALVLEHPRLMLAVKYAGYFAGLFLLLRGLDLWIVAPVGDGPASGQRTRAGVLAVVMSALLIVATEPFLLKAAPASEYKMHLQLPMLALGALPSQPAPANPPPLPTMETSTLVSIGVFGVLQVVMYMTCLRKIREIEAQDVAPLLKLRLMENEENLFDSGLYVGMLGTAAALVLQVLGVIEPNLLAAYTSNLFGIVCVALVKIRHVRLFKRRLILDAQKSQAAA
jgi:hypothetical protein